MKKKGFWGINRNVIILSIISFLNDISSEMVMPILPLFIKSLGGGGLIIGLIGGVRDSIANILKVFSGHFSDVVRKRKIFIFNGYFLSAFFKFFMAISKTWQTLFVWAGLERTGKALREAPRDALIADYTPVKKGLAFGVQRSFNTAGAVVGSILVFLLVWIEGWKFKSIILLSAFVGFFALIPFIFLKEKFEEKGDINLKFKFKLLSKKSKLFILIASCFALANFSYMFFVLRVQEFFKLKQTYNLPITALPIFFYVIFNIVYSLFAIPLGMLYDKVSRKKVIIFGYFLFSLTCFGFIFAKDFWSFILLFIAYGVVYATIEGNQRAYVADMVPDTLRGTALGVFHTLVGICALFSSLIAGFLWQHTNHKFTFLFGSIVSMISVILFLSFRKKFKD